MKYVQISPADKAVLDLQLGLQIDLSICIARALKATRMRPNTLAKRAKVPLGLVVGILLADTDPTIEQIARIARVLGLQLRITLESP